MEFDLDITPTPQQRPRHATRGGIPVTYKNRSQKEHEVELEVALSVTRPRTPLEGPLSLKVTAFLRPVSVDGQRLSKAAREALYGLPHRGKPDIDNLLKQLMDCMTRCGYWNDDRQVAEVAIRKVCDANPRWRVTLEPIDISEPPWAEGMKEPDGETRDAAGSDMT